MPFINPASHKIVRGTPPHLMSFLVPDIKIGDVAVQLNELNGMRLSGTQDSKGYVIVLNCQRPGDHSYCNGQHRQGNVHNGLVCNC